MATTRTKYINDAGANSFSLVFTTDNPVTLLATDRYVLVGSGEGGPTINLPATPVPGEHHYIRDFAGTSSNVTITISGNGNTIDGLATKLITVNGASLFVMWDGTDWKTAAYGSNFVAGQDLAGSNTGQTVVALTGSFLSGAFRVAMNASYLQWSATATTAVITIAGSTSTSTIPLQIIGQAGTTGVTNGGPVVLNGGTPFGGGTAGYVSLQCASVEAARAVGAQLNATTIGIGGFTGTLPTLTSGTGVPATTPANGSLFLRTDGTDGSTGTYTRQAGAWFALGGGGGGFTAGGDLTGTGSAQYITSIGGASNGGGTVALNNNVLLQWSATSASPTITQLAVNSGTGLDMLIQAQINTGVGLHGGRLLLAGGSGGGGTLTNGDLVLRCGGIDELTVSGQNNRIQLNLGLAWSATATTNGIYQLNTSGTTHDFFMNAQGSTGANPGGIMHIQGGLTTGSTKGGVRLQMNANSSESLVEIAEVAVGRRVVSLAYGANISATQMPANTGDLVLFLANAATAPTTGVPVGGGILYSTAGALHWKGSGGTDTPIAPA